METAEKGPDVEDSGEQLMAVRLPLTGILEELGCDGDAPPLASGNAPEGVAADQLVGHVAQAQLGHDRLHLRETKPRRRVTAGRLFHSQPEGGAGEATRFPECPCHLQPHHRESTPITVKSNLVLITV